MAPDRPYFTQGLRINDGISPELSSMSYVSLDHLASLVTSVGRGALLVKADIKEAYRMVPIHSNDQHLLGIQWEDSIYIDRMLPFGLRSAPKVFSAIANTLQWILIQQDIKHILYYLDDFILIASCLDQAHSDKATLITTFHQLGIPLELSKLEGPSVRLPFLGNKVDTEAPIYCLPSNKLQRLQSELSHCIYRRSITKRELQSLTGLLQFATKIVHPGKPFLRQLYAMQNIGSHPEHHVRLNSSARADILWWHMFTADWNGISMLWNIKRLLLEFTIVSDASGSWDVEHTEMRSGLIYSGQLSFFPSILPLKNLFQ